MTEVLLCATDAGGVRNLAALSSALAEGDIRTTFLTRREMRHLFSADAIEAVQFLEADDGEAARVLERTRPAAVICGTTRHSSPDREMVRAARAAGVRSVVVVDEWYNYRYRFSGARTGGELSLPDAIALPDDRAVREASAEGIPNALCHATGSPSLSAIVDLRDRWRALPPPFPKILGDKRNTFVVTFLSETHETDYGASPGESGAMGSYLGYTERTVRETLLEVVGKLGKEVLFVDKLHPSAGEEAPPEFIPTNVEYRVSRDAPTLELCFHSDAVVGMRSMALLEAVLLNRNVASFQPGMLGAQQCAAVRLGFVPQVDSAERLEDWLGQAFSTGRVPMEMTRPEFAAADAPKRIVDLAVGVAQR